MSPNNQGIWSNKRVGQYQVGNIIGSGTFAVVYRARHVQSHEIVAIKIARNSFETGSVDHNARTNPESSNDPESFKKEAATVAALKHPHIIPLLDYDITVDGNPYLVFPYMENNLRTIIGRRILSLEEVLRYAIPIAQALQYVHQKRIVHRDVKPENILVDAAGNVWLADFGIAALSSISNLQQELVGTGPYMAPEQFDGLKPRSIDQYALGIMIYSWLCGETPFIADLSTNAGIFEIQRKHSTASVPSFSEKGVTSDPEIENILKRALAKNDNDRYPTITDFVRELERVHAKRVSQTQAPSRQEKKGGRSAIPSNTSGTASRLEIEELEARSADLFYQKRYKEALPIYDQLIMAVPTEAFFRIERGDVLYILQRYEEALRDYDRAIQIVSLPSFDRSLHRPIENAYIGRGNVLLVLQQYEEALAAYNRAIQLSPWSTRSAHLNRGKVLYALQRYEESLTDYETVLSRGRNMSTQNDLIQALDGKNLVLKKLGR